MLNTVTRKLDHWAKGRTVLLLLGLTIALMIVVNTVHLPITVPRIQEVSQGVGILDMHLYYTKDEAYTLLEQLQPEGRRVYSGLLWGFDFIFPALYAITFSLIVTLLYRRAGAPAGPFLRGLAWIPIAAGLFDWSENVSILIILQNYPAVSGAAYAAGWFTLGKWVFIGVSLGVVVLGLIRKAAGRKPLARR